MDSFKYEIKLSSRSRNLRLTVKHDGAVIVTAPSLAKQNLIEEFVNKHNSWVLRKIEQFKKFPKVVLPSGRKSFKKYKAEALVLAKNRVNYFNQFYGFKFNKINIRNQKTRWGSCSKKGNLSFNYKIALLSPQQADYIIVHELCHLGEFNHSRNFWNLVAKTIPNYLEIRKSLKKGILP